MNYNSCARIER